ncbi:FemAB family protein [Nostoc sp. NMS8]|uniref:FemAB family protein n=1 Tax=Nostoc sp. NMS8 TaxID=2815392 RepID=UPI0025CCD26B|nr:FemAB family protein [Nostoc sp. NMS8]MBN3960620.1 FemAB family protein [Nostoc sp. NMS8]
MKIIGTDNDLWWKVLAKIPHDIYHLPGYFELEAKRSKGFPEAILIQQGDNLLFAPYILRNCNDIIPNTSFETDIFDIISPYGYSGILISDAVTHAPEFVAFAMAEMQQILKSKHVCSAFFRLHPFINHKLPELFKENIFQVHGQTISVDLSLTDAQIWNQTKADRRNKINKCKRFGLTSRVINFNNYYIEEFIKIYEETMQRVGALKTYFEFDYDYCIQLNKKLGNSLYLCIVEFEDTIASMGLYSEYCGIVQALFGGTKTEFVKLSPSSLEIDYIRFWARERGNKILHLGGGLGSQKNSIYNFKASFSKQSHSFLTMQWIISQQSYFHLVDKKARFLNVEPQHLLDLNFFPAYRSSITRI